MIAPANVSVTLPVGSAIDRVKRLLFQPFDLGKWFVIGFCAWLAHLGEQGFHANFPGNWSHGGGSPRHEFERARDYVASNLYWIMPLVAALLIVCLAVGLVFLWLNCRGKFMFLHCVALDKAEVSEPWRKFKRAGNSLFWFRCVLGLIGFVVVLPLLALAGMMVFAMIAHHHARAGAVLGLIGVGLVLIAVGILFGLIGKFTTDFVVPIMFLRGRSCRDGWRELLGLLSANVGHFVLYVLFQIVLGLAIGVIVLLVILVTCCCAGCVMALPYLGTVFLLPVLAFKRAYSLHYLAQYGPEYDVFLSPSAPLPGSPLPPM